MVPRDGEEDGVVRVHEVEMFECMQVALRVGRLIYSFIQSHWQYTRHTETCC